MNRIPWARRAPWLICAGALADLAAQAAIQRDVPTDADWRTAAEYLRAQARPGDGFVVQPAWASPLARLHLGDLISVEEAARPDRSRQARVWIVGPERPDGMAATAGGGRLAEDRAFGHVRVRRVERAAATVVYDFTDHGRDAAPATEPRVAEIDFAPVRALSAPPPRTLVFTNVPLGARIALSAGIHDFQSRYESDEPVTVVMRVGGEEAGRLVVRNEDGWKAAAIDTAKWAGTTRDVTFESRAARPAHRTLAFHAEAQK